MFASVVGAGAAVRTLNLAAKGAISTRTLHVGVAAARPHRRTIRAITQQVKLGNRWLGGAVTNMAVSGVSNVVRPLVAPWRSTLFIKPYRKIGRAWTR